MLRLIGTVEGSTQFDRTFTRFTGQLRDLRQLWPGVIIDLRAIMREQFAGQGIGPHGGWARLSPRYAAWKARRYPGKTILRRTDRLYNSLTRRTADSLIVATPRTLRFGSFVPYGRYHQRGTTKMAARQVFDLNEAQRTQIMKTIHRRLLSASGSGVTLG